MIRASVLLFVLIGLCSLGGCAGRQETLSEPPLILTYVDCPSPHKPVLPFIDGEVPLDSLRNIEIFLERDDLMRSYIKGLEATVQCYQRRTITGDNQ